MTTTAVVLVVPFPFVDTKFDFVDKDRVWSLFLTDRVLWRDSDKFFGASCNSKPFLASVSSPRPQKMPYFRSNSRRNFVCKKKSDCHMGSFNNYVDSILSFFDNLPLRGYFLLWMWKSVHFMDHLSTSSSPRSVFILATLQF